MPHDIHPLLKNYKHTGPWKSLPVCYLGDLDLRFFSYIRVQNGVGFRTENMSCESRASGSLWLVVALVTAMCTLLPLLRSKIQLFFFADCWHCQLVSVFRPFLGRDILNVRHLKIGRLHGVSNIQQWTERSSGFFATEASTKCGGMTIFN